MKDNLKLSPAWEKAKILSVLIASIVIPIVIAFIGNAYTKSIKNNEINIRYVELAINILNEPPETEGEFENLALRSWAIEIINNYSEIPLSQGAILELEQYQMLMTPIRDIR